MHIPKKNAAMYMIVSPCKKVIEARIGAWKANEKQKTGLRPSRSPSLGMNKQPIADPAKTAIAIRAVALLGLHGNYKVVYKFFKFAGFAS